MKKMGDNFNIDDILGRIERTENREEKEKEVPKINVSVTCEVCNKIYTAKIEEDYYNLLISIYVRCPSCKSLTQVKPKNEFTPLGGTEDGVKFEWKTFLNTDSDYATRGEYYEQKRKEKADRNKEY